MLLKKKEITVAQSDLTIKLEEIDDDLLMISLFDESYKGIPSYWRLTDVVGIPPLEIGVDSSGGFITNVTFFVDGTNLVKDEDFNMSRLLEGSIIVDTSIFTKVNDYIDVNKSYNVNIFNDRLICEFERRRGERIDIVRNGRLGILVDSNDTIVGFVIYNLSSNEIDMINSCSIN